ncbi:HDOD domain-containing protein [Motilimonas eburnea]|uniref:HDOD domain-containing protein n=1 Tax=Motilimonas eburnea TaxID=1737488 RepID=UPI001E63CE51|nr:HDOD domain-containing protein [Motilimonas eburnea]MCE2572432.1 HDOD domain-containing protein [Motilimonas eburnea]
MSAVQKSNNLTLAQRIHTRFDHFLVGKNYVLGDEDFNDGLELELLEQEEDKEVKESGWSQRILLDVEKARVEKEQAAKRQRAKALQVAASYFNKRHINDMLGQLSEPERVMTHLLRMPSSTTDLLLSLTLPFPRLSAIGAMLEQNPEVKRRLLYLVGSDSFMELLGRKPRAVKDAQAAVGLLGVEILKQIVPAMVFKYRIKMHNAVIPGLGKKLWRHILTTGLATSYLLEQQGYKRPAEGMMLGGLLFLGHMACLHQFLRSFDETMVDCLNEARQKGDKKFHDLLFDVEADPRILEKFLQERALEIGLALAKQGFQEGAPQLITALQEEVDDLSYDVRSTLGKALFSGLRFSIFEQLRAAKSFSQEELTPWREYTRIAPAMFKEMHNKALHRIDYSQFGS